MMASRSRRKLAASAGGRGRRGGRGGPTARPIIAKPALVAVAMYAFVIAWNEFLFALVFTNGLQRRPLSVALAFFIDEAGIQWGELMAASVVMSIPAVLVFSFAQKLLVRGLSDGAVKG